MDIQDGYYFIFSESTGNITLVCNTATGRATVQASATRADFLKGSSSMVFRVQPVKDDDAYLIYNEKYGMALALQAPGGLTVTLRSLDENDQRQWWRIQRDRPFAVTAYVQSGSKVALQSSGAGSSNADGGYYTPGSAQQQWQFFCISDATGADDVGGDDVKENRAWLREMLRYYTSNISQAYLVIGTYPYDRSHITHPNSELRKAIAWQNK
ncbi:hypothetical protein EKO27_g6537 [Xylaria grammica]|uniref:Uncharacterized protein n=1 Tax=Xylaria grammica TaxID=363999 RepID=A0A439D297_9PEZI|nr:hypothetical protein EKO27_g6537 [Xylaria grammica]